eukprot:568915-Rhodomonas_salina.2
MRCSRPMSAAISHAASAFASSCPFDALPASPPPTQHSSAAQSSGTRRGHAQAVLGLAEDLADAGVEVVGVDPRRQLLHLVVLEVLLQPPVPPQRAQDQQQQQQQRRAAERRLCDELRVVCRELEGRLSRVGRHLQREPVRELPAPAHLCLCSRHRHLHCHRDGRRAAAALPAPLCPVLPRICTHPTPSRRAQAWTLFSLAFGVVFGSGMKSLVHVRACACARGRELLTEDGSLGGEGGAADRLEGLGGVRVGAGHAGRPVRALHRTLPQRDPLLLHHHRALPRRDARDRGVAGLAGEGEVQPREHALDAGG